MPKLADIGLPVLNADLFIKQRDNASVFNTEDRRQRRGNLQLCFTSILVCGFSSQTRQA